MKRVLITICGRAGSKGFRNKNLTTFCEKPLVYYTLSAAFLFKAARPDVAVDVCLNTDSELLVELVKANVDVAKRCFTGCKNVNPGIVKVPVNLKSMYGQAALANAITLTPGTITMEITEEDGQTYYYIHWIDAKLPGGEEAGEEIKGRLERGLRRVWE